MHSLKHWVEKYRFQLLLLAACLVLILPAFSGTGFASELFLVISLSFLFIQSMIVASTRSRKRAQWRILAVAFMILIFWLDPVGVQSKALDIFRLATLALFFIFVTVYLLRFIRRSSRVDIKVILTAITVYLLIGIIYGSLAFLMYELYDGAYKFPETITGHLFSTFNYYSFITMSTVGYGDIVPLIPETRTLAYFISVTGQLYIGIIIAILVGKFMVHAEQKKAE